MQRSWALRFGLTSGHEKAAFVKARARDREVAQRSSLGSSVARQEGRRLGTQHRPLVLSCSVCNRSLCNTLQTARNRLGSQRRQTTDDRRVLLLPEVRDLVLRSRCLGPYPLAFYHRILPATSRSPKVERHLPHLSSTRTHTQVALRQRTAVL